MIINGLFSNIIKQIISNNMKGTNYICKWLTISGLAGLGVFCLTFALQNQPISESPKHETLLMLAPKRSARNTVEIDDTYTLNEIQRFIDIEREIIHDEMMGYEYPNGKYNISATKLEDLVIEENGKPIRSLIITTWRTGSTFLGAILDAHPGNLYYFEPLLDFQVQIRDPSMAAKALQRVRALLNCQYEERDEYIEYAKANPRSFNHTKNLWMECQSNYGNICYNHRFLSGLCKLLPFQSMKIMRLRLQDAQELLSDEKLALRIVLLVRDPRGTIQSRKHRSWCPPNSECSDPASLCRDLVTDYNIAMELLKKYPTTFRVIRYEDLATDPYKQVEELSKFYGRNFHPDVKQFLDTHTTTDIGGPYELFRNSKTTPFHWRMDMEFEEVEEIQRNCETAMEYWGYVPAMNASHQNEFNPVTDYVLNL